MVIVVGHTRYEAAKILGLTEVPVHVAEGLTPNQVRAYRMAAMRRAMDRPRHLPGMVTLYGPSGWGKTTAAVYVANQTRAYYVQANSGWTRKAVLLAVLKAMGIRPAGTVYQMTDLAAEQLALSGRPLIVDEMDHLVTRNAVEVVRDVYEASGAAVLLIGEEHLPAKLKRWERFHGRMLDWVPSQPAGMQDAAHLRALYCRRVVIADDLLVWATTCPDCGDEFAVTTTLTIKGPTRRCPAHRQPGRRVESRRW